MPITSLKELIQAGGHRTIERIITHKGFDIPMAADYLLRRFGSALQVGVDVIAILVDLVARALGIAIRIQDAEHYDPSSIPALPGYPPGLTYRIIGYIEDPLRPQGEGRDISFPMNIYSDRPLSREELRQSVDKLIEEEIARGNIRLGDNVFGNISPQTGRDDKVANVVRERYGGQVSPRISVISVYQGE